MNDRTYQNKPGSGSTMPSAVPFLVVNEAAERFSYYGMRAILVVFMTEYLLDGQGNPDVMVEAEARKFFHIFASAVYFFPAFGALLADIFWGKFKTIVWLSLVYCLGHVALALDHSRVGLTIGLTLIAMGSGGIKPCVSANVGDQFGAANSHLITKVFLWFYFAINLGAGASTLMIPLFLQHYGPHVAFGIPGLLMLVATWVFWVGRWKYAHIPPMGLQRVKKLLSRENLEPIIRLTPVYLFVSFFWALYDQTASAWVLQAKNMDRHWLGIEWLPSQIQAVNPILVMILIPLFVYVIYPAINQWFSLSPLRKISIGFFVTIFSFMLSAWIESQIVLNMKPTIAWQLLAFVIITCAEVMVSITCLEFSYTQAPHALKSVVMALFLFSVSLGNAFTALVNYIILNEDGTTQLSGPAYYWFFAGIMTLVACGFLGVIKTYQGKIYIQGGENQEPSVKVVMNPD